MREDRDEDGVRTRLDDDGRGLGGVCVWKEVEKVAVGWVTTVRREVGDDRARLDL